MTKLFAGLGAVLRRLRGAPLFTVFAVACVAVIVGVSARVYSTVRSLSSVADGVALPQEQRPLPEPLRSHLRNERLDVVTSIRGLPLGVRDALARLFDSHTLDIVDPGAEFQATGDVGNPALPIRRLAAAGCSIDHCLVYYQRGGSAPAWQVALFEWTPAATRFEWGASAPGGMATIDEVRRAVLSGAINRPNAVW